MTDDPSTPRASRRRRAALLDDRPRRARRILGPISDARLDALVERLRRWRAGDHVLEIGCGKAELLVRLLDPLARRDRRGLRPQPVVPGRRPGGGRGRRRRRRRGALSLDRDGRRRRCSSPTAAWRMTVAMGATGVYEGSQAATVAGLAGATRPGGLVVFGDGLWIREPSAGGSARVRDGPRRAGRRRRRVRGPRRGGRPARSLAVEVVDDAEWDAYEARLRRRRSRPGRRRTPTTRSTTSSSPGAR